MVGDWVAAGGEAFPALRVRPIRRAQDALSSNEEDVYDALWHRARVFGERQRGERDEVRFVQAGYDWIVKDVRLEKRTIQRVILKLIEKNFVAVQQRAGDSATRVATVYKVFGYRQALDQLAGSGYSHFVKSGQGIYLVKPAATVDTLTTVDRTPTVDALTTVTVDRRDTATVDRMTTNIEQKTEQEERTTTTTEETAALHHGLRHWVRSPGMGDAPAILRACRGMAPDCTVADVLEACADLFRRSHPKNPVGLFIACAPAKVAGIVLERQFSVQAGAAPPASPDPESLEMARQTLDDPHATEWERAAARSVLGDMAEAEREGN